MFGRPKSIVGMIHVGALPGTPFASQSLDEIERVATEEAGVLAKAGFDALIVENMHDRPYVHGRKSPEIVAAMTRLVLAVKRAAPALPLGVQVLSGGNHEALAIAHACGAQFIRCENFVFSHVADEGLLDKAEAGELLRFRKHIGAEGVKIFCDLKKKHASHAITADISLSDAAEAAAFFGADGLIVTGPATGKPTRIDDVALVRSSSHLPVLVGSGVVPEQIPRLFAHADALIVGSSIKKDGLWSNPLDLSRVEQLVRAAR